LKKGLLLDIGVRGEQMCTASRYTLKCVVREFCGFPPVKGMKPLIGMTPGKPRTACKKKHCFAKLAMLLVLGGIALFDVAAAQTATGLEGGALVEALRNGGYNIYFRHAATDWSQNDQVSKAGDWTSCDPGKMRQLSEVGRQTAASIGDAMRRLQIPIGRILASPYCRTVETARNMNLGPVETTTDIMNLRVAEYFGGQAAVAERAGRRLSMHPQAATNTLLVAHGNVLVTATDVYPQEAEAIVFGPRGNGAWTFVARISPQEWTRLAAEYGDR
jgi:broad specificity phosphatase PhoE